MRNKDCLTLLAIALLYRLAFLLFIPRVLDSADSVHYAETARLFAAGELFAHNPKIPVLYPLLGAMMTLFTRDPEWGCRLVSFLFSTLTVLPVYGIAMRLFQDRRTAWWAGFTVAIWPWLADYGAAVSTEATAVFFWLSGFWLLLALPLRRPVVGAVYAALIYFALHLTRAEGMFIGLAALPVLLLMDNRNRGERFRTAEIFAAAFIGLVIAHSLYNRVLVGSIDPNVRIGFIIEEFDFYRFTETAIDTLSDVIPVMLGPVMLLFIGIGLFAPERARPSVRGELGLLVLCAVQIALSWSVLSPAPRYLMAPLIAFSLWSGAGLVMLMRWSHRARQGEWLQLLPPLALVAFMLVGAARTLAGEYLSDQPRQPVEYKEAGLWMKEHLEPGLVFTRKPQVAYYAGMPSTGPLDTDSLEEALARAREAGAKYVVVDERYAPPGLRGLLDGAAPGLVQEQRFEALPKARVVVYSIQGQ